MADIQDIRQEIKDASQNELKQYITAYVAELDAGKAFEKKHPEISGLRQAEVAPIGDKLNEFVSKRKVDVESDTITVGRFVIDTEAMRSWVNATIAKKKVEEVLDKKLATEEAGYKLPVKPGYNTFADVIKADAKQLAISISDAKDKTAPADKKPQVDPGTMSYMEIREAIQEASQVEAKEYIAAYRGQIRMEKTIAEQYQFPKDPFNKSTRLLEAKIKDFASKGGIDVPDPIMTFGEITMNRQDVNALVAVRINKNIAEQAFVTKLETEEAGYNLPVKPNQAGTMAQLIKDDAMSLAEALENPQNKELAVGGKPSVGKIASRATSTSRGSA